LACIFVYLREQQLKNLAGFPIANKFCTMDNRSYEGWILWIDSKSQYFTVTGDLQVETSLLMQFISLAGRKQWVGLMGHLWVIIRNAPL